MPNVEINTGRYVKRFEFWNPSTWAIPALYWDTFSQEQRIHAICRQLSKVIAYADYLGVNVDDIAARLKAIEDGELDEFIVAAIEAWFEDNQPAIMSALAALNDALPIANFDNVNTVKSAIDTVSGNVTTLSDTVDTISNTLDEQVQRINMRQSQNTITPLLLGTMVFSRQNGMYDHPGCICSNGTTQYVYSQPESPANNNAHSRIISIQNNQDDPSTMETVAIGHCNSAAFDENNGKIYIAPVFDYSGGSAQEADYIDRIDPNGTVVTQIQTPEWIMAVSFDSVSGKLYALAYSGKIYQIDEDTDVFTHVATANKTEHDEYNQDFAIHDGKYCISSPDGFLIIGTLAGQDSAIAVLSRVDSSYLFEWGELDGMEFNEYGNLLAIAHSNQLDDRPTFVYEIPVFDDVYPLFTYMIQPSFNIGINYTMYVDQANTALRCDGFTSAKGLKSFNFLNLLADDTQRSVVLQNDYTCQDFRIGNDVFNWVSLSGHTLRVTGTCTIQTAVIFNGTGTVRVANPIVVNFGIARIGFAGNVGITLDSGSGLIASNPVGTFVTFGGLNTISPSGLKLHSSLAESIATGQVYILGTVYNS